MREKMNVIQFIVYGMFLAMSLAWTQLRRGKGLAGTVIGSVTPVAVLWVVLRLLGS